MYLLPCAANEDSNQPAHPPSLIAVYAVRKKKFCVLSYPNAPSEDSDQTVKAQADLNLRWAHMFEGTFSKVAAHIMKIGH